jgi:cytoskeletal protein CcmA (bactofilin family)
MFSKTRVTEPRQQPTTAPAAGEAAPAAPSPAAATAPDRNPDAPTPAARPRSAPSILSNDLTVVGNIRTQGDIQIEGKVEGDIRAHQLIIGQTATINGEIVADEVVVHGRVVGRVRGLKVRLTASARVEGDIIHKTIAIESGAHFEGSVQRQDDPLSTAGAKKLPAPNSSE